MSTLRRYGIVTAPEAEAVILAVKAAARRLGLAFSATSIRGRVNLYFPAQPLSIWVEVLREEDGLAAVDVARALFEAATTAAKAKPEKHT